MSCQDQKRRWSRIYLDLTEEDRLEDRISTQTTGERVMSEEHQLHMTRVTEWNKCQPPSSLDLTIN
jgi:hypothetical protein